MKHACRDDDSSTYVYSRRRCLVHVIEARMLWMASWRVANISAGADDIVFLTHHCSIIYKMLSLLCRENTMEYWILLCGSMKPTLCRVDSLFFVFMLMCNYSLLSSSTSVRHRLTIDRCDVGASLWRRGHDMGRAAWRLKRRKHPLKLAAGSLTFTGTPFPIKLPSASRLW